MYIHREDVHSDLSEASKKCVPSFACYRSVKKRLQQLSSAQLGSAHEREIGSISLLALTMTVKDVYKQDQVLKHTGFDHVFIAKPEESKVCNRRDHHISRPPLLTTCSN